ncbi:MAG: PqqD family protein [Eubacteriales bacterium]|nr:PqqD family protein [Eubacteriales bacterium]
MKRNSDFILKTVAGRTVLVPVGQAAAKFPGMVSLNKTGVYLWECLESEQGQEGLLQALARRFEVEANEARTDLDVFLRRLQIVGAICSNEKEEK